MSSEALGERITAYLVGGGLFNPELANHTAVRDLLIECRDALAHQADGGTAGARDDQPGPTPGYPKTSHDWLAALLDVWDDGNKNAPEHRCYVPGAFAEAIERIRAHLAATPAAPQDGGTAGDDAKTLREQAQAWLAVACTLNAVCPDWAAGAKNGMDSACDAIRRLASPPSPPSAPSAPQALTEEQMQTAYHEHDWASVPHPFRGSVGFERGVRFAEKHHGVPPGGPSTTDKIAAALGINKKGG
jgi:hypothetical protein